MHGRIKDELHLRAAVTAALCGLLLALSGALAPQAANADVQWLCKPGLEENPCDTDLETTVKQVGVPDVLLDVTKARDAKVDCFYVYPTVSEQPTLNADKTPDRAVRSIAAYQASRFSEHCRVFAPVYRQRTLAAVSSATPTESATSFLIAYSDVLEAFRQYLAQDNGNRGFVLIGHSQGASLLRKLVRDTIDNDAALRDRLVSAILLGGNVTVARGALSGGDFQNVPGCTSSSQLGCVVAYSTYYDDPNASARFGVVPSSDPTGSGAPLGPASLEVLCTNPASLGANARTELTTLFQTAPYVGAIGAGLKDTFGGLVPGARINTTWLEPEWRYTGQCQNVNGANVLKLQPSTGAIALKAFPDATWGTHLLDANLALGQLVDLVGAEAEAYVASHPLPAPVVPTPPAPVPGVIVSPPTVTDAVPVTLLPKIRPTVTVSLERRTLRRVSVKITVGKAGARSCQGVVRLSAYDAKGKRVLRRSIDSPSCLLIATLKFPPSLARKKITVRGAFLGNSLLEPRSAMAKSVALGK